MSRRARFAAILAFVTVLAGVVVATAAALAFSDDSCDNSKPCRPPDGVVGKSYSHVLKAMENSGNGPPYSFEVINGALPPGLTLASNGPITGSPTQSGTYTFWVELSDKPTPPEFWCKTRGSCAQRDFTIKVLPGISINNQTAKPGTVGQQYSEPLTATLMTAFPAPPGAPLATASWSVASGTLPPGVTLGADGVLSGTPTAEGDYQFVVRAELDPQRFDTETLVLSVRAPVSIAAPTVPLSEVGVAFRLVLVAAGGSGTGTYTWSLTSGALPLGVALAADGSVAGTPRGAGAFPFTATATDKDGRTAEFAGQITVAQRLAIRAVPARKAKVGKPFRLRLRTTGGVLPKRWRIVRGPLPRGVRFDRTLGLLSGTPKRAGRYFVVVEAVDGLRVRAKRVIRIKVLPSPPVRKR